MRDWEKINTTVAKIGNNYRAVQRGVRSGWKEKVHTLADIKAFRGVRYTANAGAMSDLVCPPYDIVGEAEKQELLNRNANNCIRLELPSSYDAAAEAFKAALASGVLKQDDEDSVYVTQAEFEVNHRRYWLKGFIALEKLHGFEDGVVLPHENTLSKAKDDRLNLLKATGCQFSPVYTLYPDPNKAVHDILESVSAGTPDTEFTDGYKVVWRVWRVTDTASIAALTAAMADKPLYIADGHHRYETGLNYREVLRSQGSSEGDYIAMMMVNIENSGLAVFPTHRIIKNLLAYNYDWLMEKCSEFFEIQPHLNREKGEEFSARVYEKGGNAFVHFNGDNNYTLLTLRDNVNLRDAIPNSCDELRALDVTLLHKLVLERFLGIDEYKLAEGGFVDYTREPDVALQAVDGKRADCAFLLNPTRVLDIEKVSAAGAKMPQKSTYFYPKIITGLVFNKIQALRA